MRVGACASLRYTAKRPARPTSSACPCGTTGRAEYRGEAHVIYGHTPVPEADWLNRTLNIDTGCVFGGKLTALRWPERDIVSVPAKQTYAEPAKPFLPVAAASPSLQQQHDDLLDLADVSGKRIVQTPIASDGDDPRRERDGRARSDESLRRRPSLVDLPSADDVAGRDEHAAGLARISDRSLRLLPSQWREPRDVRREAHGLARRRRDRPRRGPRRRNGSASRRAKRASSTRAPGDGSSRIAPVEESLLNIVREALTSAGFWDEFQSDWFCLDCELMPWSAKAQDLLRTQYAAVGSASRASVAATTRALEAAQARYESLGVSDLTEILTRSRQRQERVARYVDSYRRYCLAGEVGGGSETRAVSPPGK